MGDRDSPSGTVDDSDDMIDKTPTDTEIPTEVLLDTVYGHKQE